ncbi:MAG: hypothetical protein KIT11_10805 [Fimbriimonadaceae bacterium]|nr:hypothetical protein [Fimbriimonadaceae bacterium]QYK55810.1 MAG: hypothetical protein KF733_12475 [Fimbriimonadaceae bacterium]
MSIRNILNEADLIQHHIFDTLVSGIQPNTEFLRRHAKLLMEWIDEGTTERGLIPELGMDRRLLSYETAERPTLEVLDGGAARPRRKAA